MSTSGVSLWEALEKGIALRPAIVDAVFLEGRSNIWGAIIEGVGAPYSEKSSDIGKYIMNLPQRFPELEHRMICPRKDCDESEMSLMNCLSHCESVHGSSREMLLKWLRYLRQEKKI